jgi:hypothetical protein
MSPQDLTNAIISGINAGGEQFLEGTVAAVLPVIWLALLGLHLGRPYILDMVDRFTLRLGADLLWLIYIALRDLLIVSGVIMSLTFLYLYRLWLNHSRLSVLTRLFPVLQYLSLPLD